MNERIETLAKVAGYDMINKAAMRALGFDVEKFAELIVRECVRVPYAMWDKAELNADVAVKIDHKIKDHFGVEE
jgi:hypothetical protein